MQERAGLIAGNNRRGPREALDPHAEEQDKIMERIKAIQDNVQRAHRVDVVDLTVTKEIMHLSDRIPKTQSFLLDHIVIHGLTDFFATPFGTS